MSTPIPIPDWAKQAGRALWGKSGSNTRDTFPAEAAEVITDHWHRATQQLVCCFCGQAYPPGTPDSQHDLLTAHIRVCTKHPMRAVETENAQLIRYLKACRPHLPSHGVWAESHLADIDGAIGNL